MAKQNEDKQQEQVAQGETMTAYGLTVDGIIEAAKADSDKQAAEILALKTSIAGLEGTVAELTAANEAKAQTIKDLNVDLAVAKVAAEDAKLNADAFRRLPGGGVRLLVTLDVDEAGPLLSWADSAGEDPATYIATQIKDALVAVTSS